jgi:hypothetical protein
MHKDVIMALLKINVELAIEVIWGMKSTDSALCLMQYSNNNLNGKVEGISRIHDSLSYGIVVKNIGRVANHS